MKHTGEKPPRPGLLRRVVTIVLSVGVNKLLRRVGSTYTHRRAALSNGTQRSIAPASQGQHLVPHVRVASSYLRSHPGVAVGVLAAAVAVAFAWKSSATLARSPAGESSP